MKPSKPTTPAPIELYASVGGAAFIEGLLQAWAREGHAVHRVHSLDEATYRVRPPGSFGRLRRRWLMYGGYAWRSWRAARLGRWRNPIRVVTTNPFFAPAWVRRSAGSRGVTINLLYDLYPEALELAGTVSADGWVSRRCAAITRSALRECDATVFLGERLRRHAEGRHGAARRATVIPVGADGAPFRDHPPQPLEAGATVRVLYAGQMGRMHETETLRQVLAVGLPAGLGMTFHASGDGYARLQQEARATGGCQWGGPLGQRDWHQQMGAAQVALVTMARGAETIVMPSKTYSALVAGQAILAVCPVESDLADLVRQHDCGWVVEPGDVAGLQKALAEIAGSPDELFRKRRNAFQAGHAHYDVAVLAHKWTQLFASLM